jgi:glycosyltransferase involved in cell wall biosynthesis
MKTCVIIPTYNEAKHLGLLLHDIKNYLSDIIVINDGSSDSTAQVAASCGAVVITHLHNQGKGSSLIKGFAYALEAGFDSVLVMDGDGQHRPQDIPKFLAAAQDASRGLIVGNRMHDPRHMPKVRRLTNRIMSWYISRIAGCAIPDSQCGFRLIRKEALLRFNFLTTKFEIETEMFIEASRLGITVVSIPIQSVYQDEKSHINPFIDTVRFFRYMFRRACTTKS